MLVVSSIDTSFTDTNLAILCLTGLHRLCEAVYIVFATIVCLCKQGCMHLLLRSETCTIFPCSSMPLVHQFTSTQMSHLLCRAGLSPKKA